MRLKLLFIMLFMSSLSLLQSQTVVDIIVNSPDHNTLEAAVIAAGLADALSGDGPFTVFAPTDACLLYTSPSPRDRTRSRMPSSA